VRSEVEVEQRRELGDRRADRCWAQPVGRGDTTGAAPQPGSRHRDPEIAWGAVQQFDDDALISASAAYAVSARA
jgi:hypothetical protein